MLAHLTSPPTPLPLLPIPPHKLPPPRRPLIPILTQQRQRRPQTLPAIIPRFDQQHHSLRHLVRDLRREERLELLGGNLRDFSIVPRFLGEFVHDALRRVVVCCGEDALAGGGGEVRYGSFDEFACKGRLEVSSRLLVVSMTLRMEVPVSPAASKSGNLAFSISIGSPNTYPSPSLFLRMNWKKFDIKNPASTNVHGIPLARIYASTSAFPSKCDMCDSRPRVRSVMFRREE